MARPPRSATPNNLDDVIALIKSSKTPEEAREGLMSRYGLTEIQAKAILDLRLQKLTGLEQDKIKAEHAELMKLIAHLENILNDECFFISGLSQFRKSLSF